MILEALYTFKIFKPQRNATGQNVHSWLSKATLSLSLNLLYTGLRGSF